MILSSNHCFTINLDERAWGRGGGGAASTARNKFMLMPNGLPDNLINRSQLVLVSNNKPFESNGHTTHPLLWPEPVRMRIAYFPWSGSHGHLFRSVRPHQHGIARRMGTFGFASGINGGVDDFL